MRRRGATSLLFCFLFCCFTANAVAVSPPVLNLPGNITRHLGQYGPGSQGSYVDISFSGIGAGTYDVANGTPYRGWCVEPVPVGTADRTVDLYSSYDLGLPLKMRTYQDPLVPASGGVVGTAIPWDKVNYLLNHTGGADWRRMEYALQMLVYGAYDASYGINDALSNSILNDARNNGGGFVPIPGEKIAVILYRQNSEGIASTGEQDFIIELTVPCQGSIGDRVWQDLNHNGNQDPGEPGIDNVEVTLARWTGSVWAFVGSTLTKPGGGFDHGFYEFPRLCSGTYLVTVTAGVPPAMSPTINLSNNGNDGKGFDSNDPSGTTVVLAFDDTHNPTVDFGYNTPCTGSIGDFVWNDANHDGIQNDGDTGLDGVTIGLFDATGTILLQSTSTGPGGGLNHGYYQFTGVCAGSYQVKVTAGVPAGMSPTINLSSNGDDGNGLDSNNPGGTNVTLASDNTVNPTVDFGYHTPCTGSIGDFVWNDANHDGIQNDGDTGLDGVTVGLFDAIGTSLLQSTSTGPGGGLNHGYYQFTGVCAGSYQVKVTAGVPAGMSPTINLSSNGNDGNGLDSNNPGGTNVTLASDNTVNPTVDFGYHIPCTGSIGDFVWNDANHDGIQNDGSSSGIPSVTLRLMSLPSGSIVATTSTGTNGVYTFAGLCQGDYKIELDVSTLPAGYVPTTVNAPGSNPGNDSNPNPDTITLPNDNTTDLTFDFGYFVPAPKVTIIKYTNAADANDPNAAGVPSIASGGAVTWTYEVTNTGNTSVPKAQVIVTDNVTGVTPAYDSEITGNGDASFDPGEVWLFKATGTALDLVLPPPAGTHTVANSCSAGGTQPPRTAYTNIGTVTIPGASATDPSSYCNPPAPNVTIIKYTNGADANDPNASGVPNIAAGGVVTWTYKVTNTGNVAVPKAQVVVTDNVTGVTPVYDSEISGNGDATFNPGEVWLFKATGTALDLVLPPPAGTHTVANSCTAGGTQPPRTAYTNIGTVTIPGASATDPSSYCNPPAPDVTIIKYTNGADANDPNAAGVPNITIGGAVTWTYRVTNTGNTSIPRANVVVTDSATGVSPTFTSVITGNADTIFDPGEVWLYTATGTALNLVLPPPVGVTTVANSCTAGGAQPPRTAYTNVGTVTIPGASATDPSSYCNPPAPNVSIIKFTNSADANDPNASGVPNITPGGVVTWTYRVTNIGNTTVPMAQVVVTDNTTGVTPTFTSKLVGNADNFFEPGEVWLYTAIGTALNLTLAPPAGVHTVANSCTAGGTQPPSTAYTNIGTVNIPGASASDPSSYCNPPPPSFKLFKTATPAFVLPGQPVTYSYAVVNTGGVTLTNITVVDDNGTPGVPGDDFTVGVIASLAPGATFTFPPVVKTLVQQMCMTINGVNTVVGLLYVTDLGTSIKVQYVQQNVNDNRYGTGATAATGWPKAQTFNNLVGSDKAEFKFTDSKGNVVLDFFSDYITASSTFPSGYGSLGPNGGDGSWVTGANHAWLLSWTTSLSENFNKTGSPFKTGYFTNSPAETAPLSGVSTPAGWDYNNSYTVVVDKVAFGANGFGGVTIPAVHDSPPKLGSSNLITPTPCNQCIINTATATATAATVPPINLTTTATAQVCFGTPPPPSMKLTKTVDKTVVDPSGGTVLYTYTVTNTGSLTINNITVVDDNGTPSNPGDDFTVGTIASLAPGASQTFTKTTFVSPPLGPDTFCMVIDGTSTVVGVLQTTVLGSGDIQVTYVQKAVNDNRYGTGATAASGWNRSQSFNNLVGSDKAEFKFTNGAGQTVLDFFVDYISASSSFPSGYGSLGVSGGEGGMVTGSQALVLSATTSLTTNLLQPQFQTGYLTNSPPETAPNSGISIPAGWDYENSYTVIVSKNAFGASGFGGVTIPAVHDSPPKLGSSNLITPTPCQACLVNVAGASGTASDGTPLTAGATAQVCFSSSGGTGACGLAATTVLSFNDKTVKFTITNDGSADVFLSQIVLNWPAANGKLMQVKFDGDKAYDNPDIPWNAGGATMTVGGAYPLVADQNKRKIQKGTSDVISLIFEKNVSSSGYSGSFTFGDASCVVAVPAP